MNKINFINKMKEESSVFSNYSVIFDKVIKDEYLDMYYGCMEKIFIKEAGFAVKGSLNRIRKTKKQRLFPRYKITTWNKYVHIQRELASDFLTDFWVILELFFHQREYGSLSSYYYLYQWSWNYTRRGI